MSTQHDSQRAAHDGLVPAPNESVVHRHVDDFGKVCRAGIPDDLRPYLPESGPERLSALVEMIKIVLQRRWSGQWPESQAPPDAFAEHDLAPLASIPPSLAPTGLESQAPPDAFVEHHLAQFPELAAHPELIVTLIQEEFELRSERPNPPALDEYLRRFPDCSGELRQHLAQWPSVPGFEILAELGRGGMGVVYKAHQFSLNRVVALKMILNADCASPEQVLRFLIEAEMAARVQDPHIVQIYEVGKHEGRPYFSEEYVAGGTLAQQLNGQAKPPGAAAACVEHLARAIQVAHQQGVIHRDLKPANILVTADGQFKITDFGLARSVLGDTGLTATGMVVGTPSYMAPEQARGKSKQVGPAADVYALGAILYEMLTGHPPFRGETLLETLQKVAADEPVPPRQHQPAVPRDLESICLMCLRKRPAHRYATAQELADDLRNFLTDRPTRARPVGRRERLQKWLRRHPAARALSLAALLAVPLLLAASWWLYDQRQETQARALVQNLKETNVARVPQLLEKLDACRGRARPLLVQMAGQAPAGSRDGLKARLALLRTDPRQVPDLRAWLLDCTLDEFPVIRDELTPHHAELLGGLWKRLLDRPPAGTADTAARERTRFHAGMALAAYDPDSSFWDKQDNEDMLRFLAEQLVKASPDYQRELRSYLRPIAGHLVKPLTAILQDRSARNSERSAAASALALYAANNPKLLASLACEAPSEQYRILFPALAGDPGQHADAKSVLFAILGERAGDGREASRVRSGQRRAGAAITLLRLGEREKVFDVFRVTDDPEPLTQFVHRCKDRDLTPEVLLECLDCTADADERVRFALLLSLGEFDLPQIPEARSGPLTSRLREWYQHARSSGIHAACEWLLRKWGQESDPRTLPAEAAAPEFNANGLRDWFVLQAGPGRLKLVVYPPGRFHRGAPETEQFLALGEMRHEVAITRPFAILDREVTADQWRQFLEDSAAQAPLKRGDWEKRDERKIKYSGARHPAHHMTWNEAVEFCRWLTRKAGMDDSQQCYERQPEEDRKGWAFHPERGGFRLPTEAEWEYACRCGTATTFSFGSHHALLKYYGTFLESEPAEGSEVGRRPDPVGARRPNLRGLFDMHGNVWEWCHDWFDPNPRARAAAGATRLAVQTLAAQGLAPAGGPLGTLAQHLGALTAAASDAFALVDPAGPGQEKSKAYRGGSYDNYARHGRSACRIFEDPARSFPFVGLRVVCTLPGKTR